MERYLSFAKRAHLIRVMLFGMYMLGCDNSVYKLDSSKSDSLTQRFLNGEFNR